MQGHLDLYSFIESALFFKPNNFHFIWIYFRKGENKELLRRTTGIKICEFLGKGLNNIDHLVIIFISQKHFLHS